MDADAWNDRYRSTELVWSAGPNQFVDEICRDLTPGRSIDLAAGEGRNAIWLAERGWDSTAVDYSGVALDKAAELAAHRDVGVTTVTADLNDYEPTSGGYDLVLLAYLQLPDEQLTPILRRAAAAVAPGGSLVLVSHDADNIEHGYGGPQYPEVLTTPAQIVAAVGDRLTIERAETVERHVDTADGRRTALDTIVVATAPAST